MSESVTTQNSEQTNNTATPTNSVQNSSTPATNSLPQQYLIKKANWERKLLDLGLRNQLINMRKSRTLIPLLTNTINELEDALADGEEFLITPKPEKFVLPEEFSFEDLLKSPIEEEEMQKEFKKHHLFSSLTEGEIKKTIKEVYRSAKSSIEENGANTLYLALGLLKWFEPKGTTARYAPIVLVPIEITRKSATQGYTINLRDDDPQLNITMLEKLKQDFGIEVKGLDPLPLDEHGLDTKKIFDTIREYIKHEENWEVIEVAAIGIFSFTQFVMWNDLTNRSDDLIKNKIVKSLLEGKLTWEAESMESEDHVCEDDVFMAMPTDASQLYAVRSACENKSFVLHGPPGTGKSQTITSLIANALGQNKTVLFVAEKMAALEVVQKRLASIGLAPFCLELHSNKSRKKAVLEKLQQTTEFRRPKANDDYKQKAEEISKLRKELDVYSQDLHKKQNYGLSIYDLINDYELNAAYPDITPFSDEDLGKISAETLDTNKHTIELLISAGRAVGHPAEHALARVGIKEYNQSLKDNLNSKTTAYLNALENLQKLAIEFKSRADLMDIEDDIAYSKLLTTAEMISFWKNIPKSWVDHQGMNIFTTEVAEMSEHFIKANELYTELDKRWKPEFFNQNGSELSATHTQKSNSWFIPRFFGLWSLKSKVSAFAKSSVDSATLGKDLSDLSIYQSEKAKAEELFKKYTVELDSLYNGDNTDWRNVKNCADNAKKSYVKLNELYNDDNELRIKLCNNKEFIEKANEVNEANIKKEIARKEFAEIAMPREFNGFEAPINEDIKMCENILKHVDEIKEWILWNQSADKTKEAGLENVVEAYTKGLDHDDVLGAYQKVINKGLASIAIDASQTLNSFSGKVFNQKIERFITLDTQIRTLGNREIVYRLANKLPDFTKEASQSSELGILQRAIKSGGRGTSLRKLFGQIPNLLPRLCPCMLMSPISVAQYIDPNKAPFDLVIFDEASQLTTSKAVGVLARGNNAVIVGDPKQMPPTSFFSTAAVDEENLELEDMESILDDCLALNMPQSHLLWHYRSRHESLIAFSNHNFYESKLYTFPSVDDRTTKVSFVHVGGTFDHGSGKRSNKAEAEAVVMELIKRSKNSKLAKQSVGVVTFNIPQQNLIDDLFTEACKNDLDLENWAYKREDPLFIKNLENVQGDERDVIIFSVGYGPDKDGKVSMNFGPLNKEGGWRRLNVAVSRSKCEMMVFSSMLPEHIDTNRTKAEGVIALKNFLDYARNPKSITKSSSTTASKSGIIKNISRILENQGYNVDTNIGNSEFKVDLGVIDPENNSKYILGILLDGPVYADCRTTRDRELSQASVLKGLGWNIIRMWSMDWWENKELETDRLLDLLDKIKNNQIIEEEKKEDPKDELKPVEYEEPGTAPANDSGIIAKPYTATKLPVTSLSSDDFMARKNASELKKRAMQVIENEAPITEGLLTKRLLQSYSISRVGTRVQSYLDEFYAKLSLKTTTQSDGQKIYWNTKQNPDNYDDFRAGSTENDKRDSKDIPIIEAANAVYKIVSDQFSLPPEDLAKEASKQLGFARMGSNLTTLMEAAVELNKKAGYLVVSENGNITLKKE